MRDQMDLAKFDVRVRDRQLRRGALTPEAVATHIEALKDIADQAEDIPFPQPALQSAEALSAPELRSVTQIGSRALTTAASSAEDDLADEEDDDDEDDDDLDEDGEDEGEGEDEPKDTGEAKKVDE